MTKMRVHELAKELGMENKELIDLLHKKNVEVSNHMSSIEDNIADEIRKEKNTRSEGKSEGEEAPKKKNLAFVIRPQNSKNSSRIQGKRPAQKSARPQQSARQNEAKAATTRPASQGARSEKSGAEKSQAARPVPAQNPPSPVVSAPRIGQVHRLSAIPRPETVCQPATQHFRQKETDKREQAAEQTDESPIACGRNTKARPRRCRQHVLVPTAGTRQKSPRDNCKHTHRKQTYESKNPPRSTADDPLSPQRQDPPERNLIGNKSRNSRNDTYRKQTGEPSGADGKRKDSRARIRDTLS